MSRIALSGDAAGTGTFTIASPNSNSNFTLTLPQANTTVVGTDATQTLTNKTIDGSQLVAGSVTNTQLASAAQSLGIGQTWQQPSRSVGVTYTNSTGRPIMVVISCASGTINGNVYLTIGSTIVSFANWSHNTGSISSGVTLVAIIPNGSTYFVTSNGFSVTYWNELR